MNVQMHRPPEKGERPAVRAGGSSFYLAMRILDPQRRRAMFEVYSFCRAVDDIADGDEPRPSRLAHLAQWRQDIDAMYRGETPRGLEGLAAAVTQYSLRKDDFLDVIAGMEMDAAEDIRAPDFTRLELYCDRVACAVGRLSVRIFGMDEAAGRSLAHHLGQALQLTNILRDIDEDAAAGRLYLPLEALQQAGITTTDPVAAVSDSRVGVACGVVAGRARDHFAKSDQIMSGCPRRIVRAPKIMSEVYRKILAEMVAQGWSMPRTRVRIPKSLLLWIALRHAFV